MCQLILPHKIGGKDKLFFKGLKTKKMLRTTPQIFMLAFIESRHLKNMSKKSDIALGFHVPVEADSVDMGYYGLC